MDRKEAALLEEKVKIKSLPSVLNLEQEMFWFCALLQVTELLVI